MCNNYNNIMTKIKGITLISLVITIIILLILAGISIQAITSDNGLFARAKQAKEETLIQEGKEKIELAITDLMIEKTSNGENLTKEDLTKINSIEIEVGSTNNFPVEVIYKNYKYQVDENFKVTYAEEVDGTVVTYTTEPEGYTNVSNAKIKILIKITNPNGIKTIEKPGESDKILANGKQEVGLDYEVTKNGTYTFKIVASNGKETTKDVVIDNIDTVKPKDFTIEANTIEARRIIVTANTQDGDATEESSKSGIAKYEYYIKRDTETIYSKYISTETTYEFSDLEATTKYNIYVIAYDRANNDKQSSNTLTITTEKERKNIYIEANTGDDTTGNGTKEKPYKTLEKIADKGILEVKCDYNIYLGDGEYNLSNSIYRLGNENINIYGNKQNTILSPKEAIGAASEKNLSFYRLIWKDDNPRLQNYINTHNKDSFYNIIFDINGSQMGASYFMSDNGGTFNFINCTFMPNLPVMLRDFGGGKTYAKNCYGNIITSPWGINSNWNDGTNYITSTPQLDENFRITGDQSTWKDKGTGTDPDGSQADLGVYGGKYSWEN